MAESDTDPRHLIAVLLRDLSNLPVIRAMDRLVVLPSSRGDLERTMSDLELVKQFVVKACPPDLKEHAVEMFMEHVERVKKNLANATGAQA